MNTVGVVSKHIAFHRLATQEKEEKLTNIISAPFLESGLSSVLCVIVNVFLRRGGALMNVQSGAILRAINYFGPMVFQKQGSSREENTESNAS